MEEWFETKLRRDEIQRLIELLKYSKKHWVIPVEILEFEPEVMETYDDALESEYRWCAREMDEFDEDGEPLLDAMDSVSKNYISFTKKLDASKVVSAIHCVVCESWDYSKWLKNFIVRQGFLNDVWMWKGWFVWVLTHFLGRTGKNIAREHLAKMKNQM